MAETGYDIGRKSDPAILDSTVDASSIALLKGLVSLLTTQLGAVQVTQVSLLQDIATTLKKIEYHLMLATDTELEDQDVGG